MFFLLLFLHFSFFYKRKLVAKLQNRANYAQSPSSRGPFISVVSSRLSQLCQPAKPLLFFFLAMPLWAFVVADCLVPTVAKKKKLTKFGVRFYHAFRAVFIPGRRTTSLCLPDPSRPKCPAFFWLSAPLFCLSGALVEIRRRRLPQQTKPFSQCDQKPLDFFIRPSLALIIC